MTFKVTVSGPDGKPIGGALVMANDEINGQSFYRSTDGNGYSDVAMLGTCKPGDRVTLSVLDPQMRFQGIVLGDALVIGEADQVITETLQPFSHASALPAVPTRDQLCGVRNQLQGITVAGRHLFDPDIASLPAPQRLEAYAAHRAVGDTHINLSLDLNGLAGLPWRKALIREAITAGHMTGVILCCMGDGSPSDPDPGALGVEWLMTNFQAIYDFMVAGEDLTPWIVFSPGYDGVVPGWQPYTRVNDFARLARSVLDAHGSGALALELSSGYCVWSGERNDWATADGQCFDVILQEFPIEWGPPEAPPAALLLPDGSNWSPSATNDQRNPWTQIWVMQRMLGPHYNRPAMQPPDYDAVTPWFLAGGTPRGQFFYIAWERTTYLWTRKNCDIAIVNQQTAVVRALGAEFY